MLGKVQKMSSTQGFALGVAARSFRIPGTCNTHQSQCTSCGVCARVPVKFIVWGLDSFAKLLHKLPDFPN